MSNLSRQADTSASMLERDPAKPAFVAYLRVRFNDLDPIGHVNNAVYVNFLEQAAIDHAAALHLGQERLSELGGVFIARRHVIDYLKPALADDHLQVLTWIGEMQGARAARFYQIERRSAAAAAAAAGEWPRPDRRLDKGEYIAPFGELILRARTDWAYVDVGSGRPRRMPPEVLAVFPADHLPDR